MPLNMPNLLTWARILLIPLFVGVYYLPTARWPADKNLTATAAFPRAAVTDWLDGYLARKLNQTSAFGAFLDPVADKLMVAAALVMLVHLNRADGFAGLRHHRSRDHHLGAARMDGQDRRGEKRGRVLDRQAQDHRPDDGDPDAAVAYHRPARHPSAGYRALWIAAVLTLWSMVYYLRMRGRKSRRAVVDTMNSPL
jgi:cardiolipin synthase